MYDLNLAEQAGADTEFARGYCAVSHTLAYIPFHRLASLYSRLAQQALQRADRPTVKIYYWQVTGIYKLGLSRCREAKEALEQTLDLLDRLVLRRWWEESWAVLALIGYYQGYYASAMTQFADIVYFALIENRSFLTSKNSGFQFTTGQILDYRKRLPLRYAPRWENRKVQSMSDNLRRYRAIKSGLLQLYPRQLSGRMLQHLHVLALFISGIVGSKSTHGRQVA